MASHFLILLLFAFCVSVVFAALMREEPGEQARFAAWMFAGLVIAAIAAAWLMYPFPS